MTTEEKLDKILESVGEMKLTMTEMRKDSEASASANKERFDRIESDKEENKAGHKWIHERIDKAVAESVAIEERVKVVEADPIFSEWKAIKKSLVKVAVGAVLSIIVILFLVNIPAILKYLAATKGINL